MEENTKDSRSFLILLFPIGLLFLSLVILFGLGFRFYYKGDNKEAVPVTAKDAVAATVTVRDSLQKIYRNTIAELDNRLDSIWNNTDTLTGNLQIRLNEFYKLRKEISGLLRTGSSTADVTLASSKIGELQKKVEELSKRNQDVEEENKRLNELIAQLKNTEKPNTQPVVSSAPAENKTIAEKSTAVTTTVTANPATISFVASDIKLAAVKIADEREQETTDADDAEKLVATFVVKNNYSQYNNTEVEVVVTQPDGEVLQPSAWESGTFNTPEGKKIYSRKMRFDYLKGENKRLRLSLSAEKLQPGNYILQLYHNGTLIGKAVKQLS